MEAWGGVRCETVVGNPEVVDSLEADNVNPMLVDVSFDRWQVDSLMLEVETGGSQPEGMDCTKNSCPSTRGSTDQKVEAWMYHDM